MLYSLTLTIANVALPQLQGAFSATPDQISWVVTLNIVATAIVTPATGWFVARFGQRKVMIWSVGGFAISTLLCASANSLVTLLIFRVAQGAFGAPMVPLSQAIIVGTYPPMQRAMAQSIFGMSVVVGPAIGPVVGGYLAEEYNWRWVFLLVVPLSIAALFMTFAFIKDAGRKHNPNFDWTGFLSLSIAITCMQLTMDRGERLDWFESGEIIILTALMALAIYLFVAHTLTTETPFISPRLFLDRNFSVGVFLVFVYGMLNFTPIVLLPALLQNLKGYPDSLIGFLLAMRGAGLVMGFFLAGRMGKLDPRIGLVIGLLLVAYSGFEFISFDFNMSFWTIAWMGVIQGIGCGLMWVPLSVVTFASLPLADLPQGSAVFHLLRNFGTSIFVSISVMIVVRSGKVSRAELVENISSYSESMTFPEVMGRWSADSPAALSIIGREIDRQSAMIGYDNAFWLYTACCLAAIPFLLFVKIKSRS